MSEEEKTKSKRSSVSAFFHSIFSWPSPSGSKSPSESNAWRQKSKGKKRSKVDQSNKGPLDFGVTETQTLSHFQKPRPPTNRRRPGQKVIREVIAEEPEDDLEGHKGQSENDDDGVVTLRKPSVMQELRRSLSSSGTADTPGKNATKSNGTTERSSKNASKSASTDRSSQNATKSKDDDDELNWYSVDLSSNSEGQHERSKRSSRDSDKRSLQEVKRTSGNSAADQDEVMVGHECHDDVTKESNQEVKNVTSSDQRSSVDVTLRKVKIESNVSLVARRFTEGSKYDMEIKKGHGQQQQRSSLTTKRRSGEVKPAELFTQRILASSPDDAEQLNSPAQL